MRQPSGTISFLFTDIEDSSRLWDRHPRLMNRALQRHDELMNKAAEVNNGYVFTTAGDSFAIAFSTAQDAAKAAMQIQRSIRAEAWNVATPISVRIGIHTGEADERDGDYFGPAVNRAARIEAAGHGGQTLVSATTAGLLEPAEWQLTDLGTHHLKGLAAAEHIYQLDPRDATAATFAAPRTETRQRTNLTGSTAELIGRDDDIELIASTLAENRLVTITGIGGVGKTSIARAVADRIITEQPEADVWMVELAPATPGSVVSAVAKVLQIAGAPDEPEKIADVLGRRGPTTIVLDNCEHVAATAAKLMAALDTAANVTVLATSRVDLATPDEHVIRLAPLSEGDAAIDLFAREAQRHNPNFDPTTSAGTIAEICNRVDHIPLAIELAAAKVRSLDPETILERLSDVLAKPARRSTGEERHRTMTAAIDWSIGLLDDELTEAIGVCSVFSGTFDLKAAEAVGRASGIDMFELIDELVAQSLIEAERTEIGVRYRLLEPVRQHVLATTAVDLEAQRHQHLDHYLARLEHTYEILGTSSCDPILNLLRYDLDNLRAVHRWALGSDRLDDDLRLYAPLLFASHHDYFEIGDWAREVLAVDEVENRPGYVVAVCAASIFTAMGGAPSDVLTLENRRLNELHKEDPDSPYPLATVAWFTAVGLGDKETAGRMWARLRTTDPFLLFLNYFQGHARYFGDTEAILAHLQEGEEWARSIGARNFEAGILEIRALLSSLTSGIESTRPFSMRSAQLAGETGMGFVYSRSREQIVRLEMHDGNRERAGELLTNILRDAHNSGGSTAAHLAMYTCAQFLAEVGRLETATFALAHYPSGPGFDVGPIAGVDPEEVERARAEFLIHGFDIYAAMDRIIAEIESVLTRK